MNILDMLSQLQNSQSQQNDRGNDDDFVMPQQVQDDSIDRGGGRKASRQQQKKIGEQLPQAQEELRRDYWNNYRENPGESRWSLGSVDRLIDFENKYGKRNLPVDPGQRSMENFSKYKFGQHDPKSDLPTDIPKRYG